MKTSHTISKRASRLGTPGERGSALLLAMVMILILTLLGFGLLTRSLLVSEMAGAERWVTQAFYAADSGIAVAKERVKTNREPFDFEMEDLRGSGGFHQAGVINVEVSEFSQFGMPSAIEGYGVGGGQGAGTMMFVSACYRGSSTALATRTKSEARINATLNYSPFIVMVDD